MEKTKKMIILFICYNKEYEMKILEAKDNFVVFVSKRKYEKN